MGIPAAAPDGMESVFGAAVESAKETVEGTMVAVGIMNIIEDDISMEGKDAREDMEAIEASAGIEDMTGIEEDEFCCNHHKSTVGN